MERLTYMSNNDVRIKTDSVEKLARKLAEYEDLEEQGLLLKLPCKVEDTIYVNDIEAEEYKVQKMAQKLAEYADAEEQGLLLKLPCKIGDTIYEVSYQSREFVIKEHIVKEFIYRSYRFPRIEIYCENENGFLVCNNIGKLDECLFLTQAEAEQRLKDLASK